MPDLSRAFDALVARDDVAATALLLWAVLATILSLALVRALTAAQRALAAAAHEISEAQRHAKDFVAELARFNRDNAADR